jgi:hypothetical protein
MENARNEVLERSNGEMTSDEYLLHEMGHFLDFLSQANTAEYESESAPFDESNPDYYMDNKNEVDVIRGIEKKHRELKGKLPREHHRSIDKKGAWKIDKDVRSKVEGK